MVNPQELKEKIITELKEKEIIYCETLKELDWSYFSRDEKREIKNAIFENIKQNNEGWSIKEVNIILPKALPYNEEGTNTMLIHESAQIRYDEEGFIIHDYRKMSYKAGFSEEQWKVLEKMLGQEVKKQGDNEAKVENNFSKWFPFGSSSRGDKS